jgi:hypothetical protein
VTSKYSEIVAIPGCALERKKRNVSFVGCSGEILVGVSEFSCKPV